MRKKMYSSKGWFTEKASFAKYKGDSSKYKMYIFEKMVNERYPWFTANNLTHKSLFLGISKWASRRKWRLSEICLNHRRGCNYLSRNVTSVKRVSTPKLLRERFSCQAIKLCMYSRLFNHYSAKARVRDIALYLGDEPHGRVG